MKKILLTLFVLLTWGLIPTIPGTSAKAATAMGQSDGVVTIQNPETGKLKKALKGYDVNAITSLAVSGECELDANDLKTLVSMKSLETLDFSGVPYLLVSGSPSRLIFPRLKTIIMSISDRIRKGSLGLSFIRGELESLIGKDVQSVEWLQGYAKEAYLYAEKASKNEVYLPSRGESIHIDLSNVTVIYKSNVTDSSFGSGDMRIWDGNNYKGFVPVVNLSKGYIKIAKIDAPDLPDYEIYLTTSSRNNIALPETLKNAVFIDDWAFKLPDASTLVFPPSLRYIGRLKPDERSIGVTKEISSMVFGKSDKLLLVNLGIHSPLHIANLEYGGPVCIEPSCFYDEKSTIDKVVFEDSAYIGEGAFNYVKDLYFKKVPGYLDEEFVKGKEVNGNSYNRRYYQNVYIPKGSKAEMTEKFKYVIESEFYRELDENGQMKRGMTRKIELKKPSSLLSVISLDDFPQIDSLTIVGFMNENDVKALSGCSNLKYLNLKDAYICYSPEYLKDKENTAEALAGLFELMGKAADAKYNDYRMSTIDHDFVKAFTNLVSSSSKVTKSDNSCIIPEHGFERLSSLETVILPSRVSSIGNMAFAECTALKNVQLPPYLKQIGTGAFSNCSNLETISFPSTLTSIGRGSGQYDVKSFGYTKIKVLDFSHCTFGRKTSSIDSNNWYFLFGPKDFGYLRELRLPKGVANFCIRVPNNCVVYVPADAKTLNILDVAEIHFASQVPPEMKDSYIRNAKIYIPKGSTTAYYAKYGASNTYIEE